MQRDLLALDRPVRSGVRYDATTLLGRDRDLERLRALLSKLAWCRSSARAGSARRASRMCSRATPPQPVVHVVELVGVTSPEDVVGRGRLRARRARLGQRSPNADAGAAGRPPRAHRPAARAGARACSCWTTASTCRGGRRACRVPDRRPRRTCACSPPAVRRWRSPPSASTCSTSSTSPTRSSCSGERAIAARPGVRLDRRGRDANRRAGSTACRWRSSWRPRRCARWRSRRSTVAWRTASRCCAAATVARRTATGRCWRSSTGRGTCLTTASGGRCVGWPCSTMVSRWRPRTRCSETEALDAVQGLVNQSLLSVREAHGRSSLPDARDGPRVRPDAARGRRGGRRGACRPAALGDRLRSPPRRLPHPRVEQFAAIDALERRGDQPRR